MYKELRKRVDEAGLSYLTENNVARYLKSYQWDIDEAFRRLDNAEKWRREQNCMTIHESEIKTELDMGVVSFVNTLVHYSLWS